MHISDFDKVDGLVRERKALIGTRLLIMGTKGQQYVGVTFQGKYQDDEMCDAVRPVVLNVLASRIAACESELFALGVKIPTHD